MRNLLLKSVAAGAVLAALSAPAFAADLPSAAPVEPAFVPVQTWSGFYVGIQGGYAFESDDEDNETLTGEMENFSFFGDDEGGFVVGGTVGYNHQIGQFVLGVEGDASYADFGDEASGTFDVDGDGFADIGMSASLETNFFATARGRVGYAFDRFMVFATGGAAFASLEFEASAEDLVTGDSVSVEDEDFLFGYTVGGGIEAMITDNISAKIEYLYVSFDDEVELFDTEANVTSDFHVIRGGLNFKFNSLFGG